MAQSKGKRHNCKNKDVKRCMESILEVDRRVVFKEDVRTKRLREKEEEQKPFMHVIF
jgi:hypothetical protein